MISETLSNKMNTPKYIGPPRNWNRQDCLIKLGPWDWREERVEGEVEGRKGGLRRTRGNGIFEMQDEQKRKQGKRYLDWGSHYRVSRNLDLEKFPGIHKGDPS